MTEAIEIRVCDAIASWINDQADLPTHTTLKYERPPAVLPEMCPLLVVWYLRKQYAPVTTSKFDNALFIGVTWQVSGVIRATTLLADEETAKKNLQHMSNIEKSLRELSVHGWIDGYLVEEAYDLIPTRMDPEPPMRLETGLIRGYSIAVTVSVTEKG